MQRLNELENVQSGDNDPIETNVKLNESKQKSSYEEIDSDSNEELKGIPPKSTGGDEESESNNNSNAE